MTFRTHLAIGALGAMGFVGAVDLSGVANLDKSQTGYVVGLILFGSVLPDIDEPRSFISRKFPLISQITATFFKHRGPTHFLFIPVLLFVAWAIFGQIAWGALGFGMIMHHAGDMLTPSGIQGYFYPFKKRFVARILPKKIAVKTGSAVEMAMVLPAILVVDGLLGAKILGFDIDISKIFGLLNRIDLNSLGLSL